MDWNQTVSHKLPNTTYVTTVKREITFPVKRGWMTEQQSIESVTYVATRQYLIIFIEEPQTFSLGISKCLWMYQASYEAAETEGMILTWSRISF